MAKKPTNIRITETVIQNFRYFMKSIWVSRSSRMAYSLCETPSPQIESGVIGSDRQLLHPAPRQYQVEDPLADENRGEQRGQQTDAERHREALDRSGAELEQEHRRYQRGDVGVDDRGEGAVEAEIDRRAHGAPGAHLLADALEHQHVGVDRHADGQDDAGDARQG